MCAYCKAHPPAAGEQPAPHADIRRCPRAGAVCGTCGVRSAKCVGGECKTKCTNCEQIGHRKADCTQPKRPVTCRTCGGVGHRSDSKSCPMRDEAAARTCSVCGSTDHVKGAACDTLFRQWCKDNEEMLRGKEADVRKLFEEAQAPKCKACGKPGHTAGTCPTPLSCDKVKQASAEAVLRHAGVSAEGLTLTQMREKATEVVERHRKRDKTAVDLHNSLQRKKAERMKAFHRRAEAGRCYSRNRKLAAWQRQRSRSEEAPAPPEAAAAGTEAAQLYSAAEQGLARLQDEHASLTSRYNTYETKRMMRGSSAPAPRRERRLLGMIDQVERDMKAETDKMRRYHPDNVRALQQNVDSVRGKVNPQQSLVDADIEAMFPLVGPDEHVTLSTRYYRKLLNGGAGRPVDIEAQRLRPYVQKANNSLARGAEHWFSDTVQDPRVLGTELVPDEQPTFEAGFRMRVASGTIRRHVLKPRDEDKTLERHRRQFEEDQKRSDAIRREEEPCAKRLAASRARIAAMSRPVPARSRPEPPAEAVHVCDASCVCDLLDAACGCCVCRAKVRDPVTHEVVRMRRKRGLLF